MLALVAEDNAAIAWMHETALKRAGLEVELVENGLDATKSAAKQQFDVLIFDFDMPVMNGIEALRHIQSFDLNKDTPALICTGRIPCENWQAVENLTFEIVPKPVKQSELMLVVNKHLGSDCTL